jgi:tetratricopeptide (TPR) repeat protein
MTIFQLLMLGASAFFAFKIYEHIQTLKDSEDRGVDSFSTPDTNSLIETADSEMEKGNLDKALAIYSEANMQEPNSSETLFKMGYVLSLQDRDDEAIEYYKDALKLDSNNTYIHQALASAYRKTKEFASARMYLNSSLSIDDSNPITYYNYGNLLVDMKHYDEAKEMYEKALELDPDLKEAKEELEKLSKL